MVRDVIEYRLRCFISLFFAIVFFYYFVYLQRFLLFVRNLRFASLPRTWLKVFNSLFSNLFHCLYVYGGIQYTYINMKFLYCCILYVLYFGGHCEPGHVSLWHLITVRYLEKWWVLVGSVNGSGGILQQDLLGLLVCACLLNTFWKF